MSLKKQAIRFLAETLIGNALSAAGQQVGESIGKRIGARIYTQPKDASPKEEEK